MLYWNRKMNINISNTISVLDYVQCWALTLDVWSPQYTIFVKMQSMFNHISSLWCMFRSCYIIYNVVF